MSVCILLPIIIIFIHYGVAAKCVTDKWNDPGCLWQAADPISQARKLRALTHQAVTNALYFDNAGLRTHNLTRRRRTGKKTGQGLQKSEKSVRARGRWSGWSPVVFAPTLWHLYDYDLKVPRVYFQLKTTFIFLNFDICCIFRNQRLWILVDEDTIYALAVNFLKNHKESCGFP